MRTRLRSYSTKFDQPRSNGRRLRLAINLALLGGILGSAQFLINLLAQTEFPKEPQHMTLASSLIVSSRAWVAGDSVGGDARANSDQRLGRPES